MTLSPLAVAGADAARVAETSVAIWTATHAALSPVVGARGSAALFKRSLHLASRGHPWLTAAYEGSSQAGDFTALRMSLARQDGTTAAAAHDAMLQLFHDLLAELIGRSLTHRLLQAAWDSPTSGNPVQDTPS
jgi:hypothetical protein